MPDVNTIGAVVIAHNSAREIGRCLDSLPAEVETVVVDNASADGTRDEVRRRARVRLIANPWNRGFAAAANQGIGALDCEAVLVLNPDIEIKTGLKDLHAACLAPKIAAAGGKLIGPEERPQTGFMFRRFPTPLTLAFEALGVNRFWPSNPVNRRYRCADVPVDRAAEVEQPAGAMLLLRRAVWRELGGFDEGFRPVWFEDVDFLKRAALAGYRTRYVPTAEARHSGAHSVSQLPSGVRAVYWYGNLLRYAAKHFSGAGRLAVCSAVAVGMLFRAILGLLRPDNVNSVSSYGRVFCLAGRNLWSGRVEAQALALPPAYERGTA